ncbi:hypothetical protein [Actinoplanes sp. L3-i22]|uniref:hypothetical protein n=1 Tax=Actinoplanes sp. L3-i22 TaxID=2836373 RepID=UPI001C85513E|nr:hypothetical protein [Actinoplanes sp. L3-i22]
MWTYETLPLGVAELRELAIETACMQAAIPPDETSHSAQQRADKVTIEAMFAGVHNMFWPFMSSMPAPDDFDLLLDWLRQAARGLTSTQSTADPQIGLKPADLDFSRATTVSSHLGSWSGAAAREFKRNYLDPMPTQLASTYNAIVFAIKLIELEQGIWRGARTDITRILNDAIDTLRNMPGWCGKDSLTTVLTTVAAFATIAAVPLSPLGTSLAVGLAVTDGAASVGATLLPEDPERYVAFPAPTAYGVITAVEQAIAELYTRINEQEHKIARVLDSAVAVVTDQRSSYVPPSPLLANANRWNITDQDYLGFAS